MREVNDGGPAFPLIQDNYKCDGMTLRDYFAGQALVALIGKESEAGSLNDVECCSHYAYQYADAMIAERNK